MKYYFRMLGGAAFALLVFSAIGFALRPVDKIVDRAVMVNSHQYIEGMEQRARVLRANIYEIDALLLTNPLQATGTRLNALTSIEQAEPNGVFASKSTSATWVMCVGPTGVIEPVYVESKVTVYPYPVKIDYDKNRVRKAGKSTVSIRS